MKHVGLIFLEICKHSHGSHSAPEYKRYREEDYVVYRPISHSVDTWHSTISQQAVIEWDISSPWLLCVT